MKARCGSRLKFAKAFTVANSVNILFAKNGSPPLRAVNQQQQPNAPANPQQALRTASQAGFELERVMKEDGYYPWLGGQPDNPRTADGRAAAAYASATSSGGFAPLPMSAATPC